MVRNALLIGVTQELLPGGPVLLNAERERVVAEVLAALFEVAKELLDARRGREANQDASRSGTVVDKRVRNASRSEDRIARAQTYSPSRQ